MCRILSSKFIKLIFGIFFLFLTPKLVLASEYIPRGYFVIDLKNKIEWMTCPVGMVWNKNTCNGIAKKYELKFLPDIIKINLKIFPKTPPEPFWTKDKNYWQPKFNWIVNFLNGNTFGRYPGYKPNYIRLVRDRN